MQDLNKEGKRKIDNRKKEKKAKVEIKRRERCQ